MEGKKITLQKTFDAHRVAEFLRLLADELEGKDRADNNEFGWQLHGFNKLKIGLIRQEGGDLSLKLKVKGRTPRAQADTSDFTDVAELDYRPFKQQMKTTFAELNSCASQGRLPPDDVLSRFMDQSKKLISYAGFGDQYYAEYWQTCQGLEHEVRQSNLTGFQEKMAAVSALKKSCHRRFK